MSSSERYPERRYRLALTLGIGGGVDFWGFPAVGVPRGREVDRVEPKHNHPGR
jgi:hypothetical protein